MNAIEKSVLVVDDEPGMRNLAREAAMTTKKLPDQYRHLFILWLCLGWPALAAVVAIFALMVWQPRVW